MKVNSIKNYWIYPMGNPELNIGKNPYIDNLVCAIENCGNKVINKNKFTKLGVFSLLRYLFNADVFMFNWIESIHNKRFGKLQSIALPFILIVIRLIGHQIIVIFHNKYSHSGKNYFSIFSIFFSIILSNKIVTHSKEGEIYLIDKFRFLINMNKVKFVSHPVYSSELLNLDESHIIYDYIIWGAVSPYKGVLQFLNFIKSDKEFQNKRVLICGKVSSVEFYEKLLFFANSNVHIINEFIDDEILIEYITVSKRILFVYDSDSLLSSGALIKSLNFNRPIIGPRIGAFKDLEFNNIITCYNSFENIISINSQVNLSSVSFYLKSNTWSKLIYDIV